MTLESGGERRLKRGLEDLSPLFRSAAPQLTPPSPSFQETQDRNFEVQFLTICVPDHEGDAFLANAYLASQMVRRGHLFASLVSVVPGFNVGPPKASLPSLELLDSRISRFVLSHQELWTWMQKGTKGERIYRQEFAGPGTLPRGKFVFLEFEPSQFRSLSHLALLLDRMVLFVSPEVESLQEAYRTVKSLWSLNRKIEFFLLFRGESHATQPEEFFFERFSLITSRFLGISVGWLGVLALPEKQEHPRDFLVEKPRFRPEALFSGEGLQRPLSPEQYRFWRGLDNLLERQWTREVHVGA